MGTYNQFLFQQQLVILSFFGHSQLSFGVVPIANAYISYDGGEEEEDEKKICDRY